MTSRRDHYFPVEGSKWRDGVRGLSPAAQGIYFWICSILHETPDSGYPNDAAKLASDMGYRDRRTVAKPLEELIERRKFVLWRGRVFNSKVCRDRHALAVKRKARSPVPAAVWPLIEALEQSPEPVGGPVDDEGTTDSSPPTIAPRSDDDRPTIANPGAQVIDFPQQPRRESESATKSRVVAVTDQTAARARGDPPGGA